MGRLKFQELSVVKYLLESVMKLLSLLFSCQSSYINEMSNKFETKLIITKNSKNTFAQVTKKRKTSSKKIFTCSMPKLMNTLSNILN